MSSEMIKLSNSNWEYGNIVPVHAVKAYAAVDV